VARFSYPPPSTSSFVVWSDLLYFPALSLFYTVGVGALIRRDYKLLNRLVSLQVINPYRQGEKISVLKKVNTAQVIEKAQLNAAQGTNQHVPLSEMLFNFTKPFYLEFLPGEQEFDEIFDELELIVSLKFLELIEEGWFPIGRYIYRRRDQNNMIYKRFKELEAQKDTHEWVSALLFKNSDVVLKHYNEFNNRLKQTGWH
jgi:hypothetical protein